MATREAPLGTIVLIAISIGVFIADLLYGGRLLEWGAKSHLVWAGEWHRLIWANFIHSGLTHLALDMYALFIFGRLVEGLAGLGRYVAIYLLGGVAGFAFSLLASPDAYSVGSSAAIFALMGYTLHHRLRNLPLRWLPIDTALAQILGINLILGITVPNIDQFAHLGGLFGGFLCGSLFGRVDRRGREPAAGRAPRPSRPAGRIAALLILLVIYGAGLYPMGTLKWLRPVAPAAAEAMEARYGKFFAPFVATDAAVLWLDPSHPESDWQYIDSTLRLPEGPPVAFGLFWRWTRGGGEEERAAYRVLWERRTGPGDPWVQVGEDFGSVAQIDQVRGRIFRRGFVVLEDPEFVYGDWRVRAYVDGIKHVDVEYAVTQ